MYKRKKWMIIHKQIHNTHEADIPEGMDEDFSLKGIPPFVSDETLEAAGNDYKGPAPSPGELA